MRGRKKQPFDLDKMKAEVTRLKRLQNQLKTGIELLELQIIEITREEKSDVEVINQQSGKPVFYGCSKKKQAAYLKALTLKPLWENDG
ncbi:hypothetical protein M2T70_04830 [Elizabethkingia anophelis]|uniref:hypothetical protein n=1 Tax=Elizabethkingia anophelis TaxID=1117645 RepID=UPI000BA8A88F|nr:hypothetical protein [Elizabethkingia anophelis]ASV77942.1 hypothetical protein A6J37_04530 [Elizabethkingia anophelis]MCL1648269.1 hypothetical protein [Elizabethkingia anophelis]MCL1683663.1 hypothetical protein [Elizabethkingia anophelis]MDV3460771.1 hypothetical protein [Elizabethkingia anophelis]MDV3571642.1 hypothetical protein [Elizabethkingia anophelis]